MVLEQTSYWRLDEQGTSQEKQYDPFNPETGYSDGINGNITEGNIFLFNDPVKEGKGWLEKYYLYQVPTSEILLNPELTQNPDW